MKKRTLLFLSAVLALSLAACGNSSTNETKDTQKSAVSTDTEAESEKDMTENDTADIADTEPAMENDAEISGAAQTGDGRILIAYFSVMETDGVDTVAGASRVASDGGTRGNNEYIARIIQQETGGDLFPIETVQEYPTTHEPLLEFAYEEKSENTRPELAGQIENLDQYDTIFLGYPNWNADLPMPLYTFLEEYDFEGKTIIPFTSHGGSGFSRTVQTISELQPNAQVSGDGFSISRNDVADSEQEVTAWVESLGLSGK